MTTNFKRITALWLSCLLIFTLFPYQAAVAANDTIAASVPSGTYSVSYRYLEDGKSNTSVANGFMSVENSGKLIVDGAGNITFQHELTNGNYINFEYLGYRPSDRSKAVITKVTGQEDLVVGLEQYVEYAIEQANNGNVIISIPIEDLDTNPDVLMHINYKGGLAYNHWYNVQLEINKSSLPGYEDSGPGTNPEAPSILDELSELLNKAEALYDNTSEGEANGQASEYGKYPKASRDSLLLAIDSSREGILQNNGNEQLLRGVYGVLEAEVTIYEQSVIALANRAALYESLKTTKAFVASINILGTTEGNTELAYPPITAGEYFKDAKSTVQNRILAAEAFVTNYSATQALVDNAVRRLNDAHTRFAHDYYIATEPVKIYVLDSIDEPTNTQSLHAADILPTVTFLKLATDVPPRSIHANLTFTVSSELNDVVRSLPDNDGGLQDITLLDPTDSFYRAFHIINSSSVNNQVYQVVTHTALTDLNAWEGFSYVSYKVGEETRNIYISYNADLLEQLQQDVAHAQQLVHQSVAASGMEDAFTQALEQLEPVLEHSVSLAANLASKRPAIISSIEELKESVEAFTAVSIHVTDLNLLLTKGESDYSTAVEGTAVGHYKTGSKDKLDAALTVAKNVIETAEQQAEIDEAVELLTQALISFEAAKVFSYGSYTVTFRAADGIDIAALVNVNGELVYSSGKHTVTITPTEGVIIKKLIHTETNEEILPVDASVQRLSSEVAIQATSASAVQFELEDISALYKLVLLEGGAEEESEYLFQLSSITRQTVISPGTGGFNPAIPEAPEDNTGNPPVSNDDGQANEFKDITNHWAAEAIKRASKLGITTGYQDQTFRPKSHVTRAEFVAFISRALKLPEASSQPVFNDAASIQAWAKPYIAQVAEAGLISGYADQTFKPEKAITRAELAVIITRAANLPTTETATQLAFNDAANVPVWAVNETVAAFEAGLIQGKEGNQFDPNGQATRAEALTMIMRLLDYIELQ